MLTKLLRESDKVISIILVLVLFGLAPAGSYAQELNCKVVVNSDRVERSDKGIFRDMEIAFSEFLNNRRWTNDAFQNEERIKCNFNITIDEMPSISSFRATVQIQSARPVYNSNYESIVFNFADRDWSFDYVESAPLDFNPNSFTTNLTSMLAYYANIVIGLDYDTFGELSGTPFFQQANNIVTNAAPSNRPGWTSLENLRNRYYLVENLLNQRMISIRRAMYMYHRMGLDIFIDKPEEAQQNVLNTLKVIQQVRETDPNSILVVAFLDAKTDELINIFSTAPIQMKRDAYNLLVEIDPSKRDKYSRIISN